ncbi:excinuclease ABC subunit UvrC [Halocella sp. SP3-1]|uniref:excinuclease ABC subunit UvrC n=1 Tax=Halocella sp. SP3-1 TaxID=2382161 RepID=UPI0025705225|nr:excinuclease ABC subunit UvrC [Halocella sp. SP3-1]
MVINMNEQLEEQLKGLPDRPGTYLMKDELGEIIYVGKAKSLRKRVRSYFRRGNHTYKTKVLIEEIADFDYIVTDTEVEAYILEANLIKKHQPRFNIRLKDDKTYPYIKVSINEDFPRIFKTRIVKNDGARYFGPFADVNIIHKTLGLLQELFALRTCRKDLRADKPEERPCLNYYIGKCLAPCTGEIDVESYRQLIDRVCLFLSGQQGELIKRAEEMMYQASERKDFEKAAHYRDTIKALEKITAQQKVMSGKNLNQDVVALARNEEDWACIQVLFIRNGRLIGQDYFIMEGSQGDSDREIMGSFLQQYYDQAISLPDEILLGTMIGQLDLLKEWLSGKKGKKIRIYRPERGEKKRLVEMAEDNAVENLKKELIRLKYQRERTTEAVKILQQHLGLAKPPDRIEGFDISNIQGTDPVASMVVFKGGYSSKKDYRRFKIKTIEGPDDFAMMQEVIERRYSRLLSEDKSLPDLILIDGGKGQLSAAYDILCKIGLAEQEIIGLAKKEEEVFLPGQSEPIIIPRNSAALHLIQRVRDEAHRFAVSYHRKLRSRRLTHTMLDDIPGIGPKRRDALLRHFGSLAEIREASIGQLKAVDGVSSKTARVIFDYLRENTRP